MVNIDYLYNPEAVRPVFNKKHFVDKKLGFQVIENGTILPNKPKDLNIKRILRLGGIVDDKGKYIQSSSVVCGEGGDYTPPPESIQYDPRTVVYFGMHYLAWGHFITDVLKFFWFLKTDTFKNNFKNYQLVYIGFGNVDYFSEKYTNFRRLMEILEFDVSKLQLITQPTRFEKIILPDESFFLDSTTDWERRFTNEYRETIDIIRNFAIKNRTPTSSKKIYFFHGRAQFGEERIAEYFKSKGYEIIQPEKLTLDEQLNWLINCESFASTLGSCAHNSLFLRDGTETIFIRRAIHHSSSYQRAIDPVYSLNANYIDSSLSLFTAGTSYYCYIISKQLKEFFGDKWNGYEEEDFKVFLQYVKDSVSKGLAVNQKAKELYAEPILKDFMAQLKRHKDLIASYDMPPRWEEFKPWLSYQTHVSNKGWGVWNTENQISNELDKQLHIEAIKVNYPGHKIYYSVYFSDEEGWSPEVTNGLQAGTTGKVKPIMGMRVRLDEAGAKEFDILYRVHKFDGTWTPWAKNGEALYSHGQKLNAIQMKLKPIKPKVSDTNAKDTDEFDYANTFLVENDKIIYLYGQRQDLTK